MAEKKDCTFFKWAMDQFGEKFVKFAKFFVDRIDIACAFEQGEVTSPGTAGKKTNDFLSL